MTEKSKTSLSGKITNTQRRGWRRVNMACPANVHVVGACAHAGSKPNLFLSTSRRRAKNKVARRSRQINRSR